VAQEFLAFFFNEKQIHGVNGVADLLGIVSFAFQSTPATFE